jgi:hypothetical protein
MTDCDALRLHIARITAQLIITQDALERTQTALGQALRDAEGSALIVERLAATMRQYQNYWGGTDAQLGNAAANLIKHQSQRIDGQCRLIKDQGKTVEDLRDVLAEREVLIERLKKAVVNRDDLLRKQEFTGILRGQLISHKGYPFNVQVEAHKGKVTRVVFDGPVQLVA